MGADSIFTEVGFYFCRAWFLFPQSVSMFVGVGFLFCVVGFYLGVGLGFHLWYTPPRFQHLLSF